MQCLHDLPHIDNACAYRSIVAILFMIDNRHSFNIVIVTNDRHSSSIEVISLIILFHQIFHLVKSF